MFPPVIRKRRHPFSRSCELDGLRKPARTHLYLITPRAIHTCTGKDVPYNNYNLFIRNALMNSLGLVGAYNKRPR